MATDDRNFRSIYYEKVGFKSVQENKSIEMLLRGNILDPSKLKQFCLRFTVPSLHRALLWKILLGILPAQVECHNFVMAQRKQEYDDLHHALIVIKIIDEKTPKPQVFLYMCLLQTGNLKLDFPYMQEKNTPSDNFICIIKCLMRFFTDDPDLYWIARKFYDIVSKIRKDLPVLIETTHKLLEKQDQEFFKVLTQNSILESLPFNSWFECCFANVFNGSCIIKVWDKICGGSNKILAYLAVTMLITFKAKLVMLNDAAGFAQYVQNVSEETADMIVNNALDLWQTKAVH